MTQRITVPLDDVTLARLKKKADDEDRSINVQAGRELRELMAREPALPGLPYVDDDQDIES